jgi:hypothetical protein
MGVQTVTDTLEQRARKLFKAQHPDRNWDLIATRRSADFKEDNPHASESERKYFRSLAEAELKDEKTAAEALRP